MAERKEGRKNGKYQIYCYSCGKSSYTTSIFFGIKDSPKLIDMFSFPHPLTSVLKSQYFLSGLVTKESFDFESLQKNFFIEEYKLRL